jgi:hypothetical protein
MAGSKKTSSSPSAGARLRRLFSSGGTVVILAVVAGLFGGGVSVAWWLLGDRIRSEHRIGPEQVEITAQPPWIAQSDVRAEVFRNPTLDGPLSLPDDDLAERISAAFLRHPWVAKVERVTKKFGGVKVELVYRKPVCMVQVPGGLQPVDAEGMLLPSVDFTSQEAARYPILLDVDRGPTVSPGSRWGDTRVIGGAEIAAVLAEVWGPMRLRYIEPWAAYPTTALPAGVDAMAAPTQLAGRAIEPFFTLVTHNKTRIAWGHAPSANALGEPPAADKVAWLKRYFATHDDSLDGPEGKPQELDVRKALPGGA